MEVTRRQAELALSVEDESQIGAARRQGSALARTAGMSETDTGRAAIVINELATNLIRHAGRGRIFIRALAEQVPGVEVLTVDSGPGIRSVTEAFRDGHSTGGTAGTGLGAVRRLSEMCDLYTGASGTAIVARITGKPGRTVPARMDVGAASHPLSGETANGDGWTMSTDENRTCILVADGLGHGVAASAAATAAIRTFDAAPWRPLPEMLEGLHAALRPTRGAAVAVAHIDHAARTLRYVGCGNIASVIFTDGQAKNLVSHNGTTGHSCRRFTEFTYEWSPQSILVMHSDGLHHGWRLDSYPGLVERHPSLIAAVLMRDFERGRDDTTVLVARERAA
jgi:anti-sigma regulatory factor (Ser/Thr protein kinase)